MKSLIALTTACLLLFTSVSAQTRSRRTAPQKRRAAASRAGTPSPLEATQKNAARLRLGDQIKTLTRFLYLYGRFSKDLELTGSQAGATDTSAQTRAALITNLRNIRAGLEQLESEFRSSPALAREYASLNGVAQRVADAERQAAANQLDQAGRVLVEVVNRLTDVLLDM